jgi:hypothetical protein
MSIISVQKEEAKETISVKKETNEEWRKQWKKPIRRNFTVYDGNLATMEDLLKAYKVCHFKNCPFFNKHSWEVVFIRWRHLTYEEYKETVAETVKEALRET